ncbi:MAG TPA: ankyrin repeat domain-containing protein [Chthoniobacteraceae bacterium]|jgi:ankyrin repeat protein|nr:ankyrin repeat domain-containing protein [Chthoniobacteraceae bacterium]
MILPIAVLACAPLHAGEIHEAILAGQIGKVRKLLQENPALAREYDKTRQGYPLHMAAFRDDPDLIELLLANQASLEARDERGHTALLEAGIGGRVKAAKTLLAHGALVDARGDQDYTPLHYSVLHVETGGTVETLLEAGADVNAVTRLGTTPLLIAAGEKKNGAAIKTLLAHGANPEARNHGGLTAPMVAIRVSDLSVLSALLEAKQNLNIQTGTGVTALFMAVEENRPDAVKLLLAQGADPGVEQVDGLTALGWCARNAQRPHAAAMAALLRDAGATKEGSLVKRTTIYAAAGQGDNERLKLLLDQDPPLINTQGESARTTPLALAVRGGHLETVQLLLKRGAKVDLGNGEWFSPLHEAARAGNQEIAQCLLDAGAKVDGVTSDKRTPLLTALRAKQKGVADLLVRAGANVNLKDFYGVSPAGLEPDLAR